VEGISLLLDPEFDMVSEAIPFIEKVKLTRFSPERITDDIIGLLSEMFRFIRQFPKDTLDITGLIRRGKLCIQIEHQGIETLLKTHEQVSNKIAFSIIIAALIIGSALIVIAKIPPLFSGISLIGIIVFFAAAVMGIWLLAAIMKK